MHVSGTPSDFFCSAYGHAWQKSLPPLRRLFCRCVYWPMIRLIGKYTQRQGITFLAEVMISVIQGHMQRTETKWVHWNDIETPKASLPSRLRVCLVVSVESSSSRRPSHKRLFGTFWVPQRFMWKENAIFLHNMVTTKNYCNCRDMLKWCWKFPRWASHAIMARWLCQWKLWF